MSSTNFARPSGSTRRAVLVAIGSVALGAVAVGCGSRGSAAPQVIREEIPTTTRELRVAADVATPARTPSVTPTAVAVLPSATVEIAVDPPDDDPARAIADAPIATSTPASPEPTPSSEPAPPPPVAAPPPLGSLAGATIWSDGDSTSYFMSVALLDATAGLGALPVQPAPEYYVSSGLMNPSFFDWPAYIGAQLPALQPSIAVFMIGANDASAALPYDEYHARVGALMDLMQGPGRHVYWVGQPHMGRPDLEPLMPGMNKIFAEEAARRPWVTYVDVYSATSAADGSYASYLPDGDGVMQLMRADDGVHFTPAGGRLLAARVLSAILASR